MKSVVSLHKPGGEGEQLRPGKSAEWRESVSDLLVVSLALTILGHGDKTVAPRRLVCLIPLSWQLGLIKGKDRGQHNAATEVGFRLLLPTD